MRGKALVFLSLLLAACASNDKACCPDDGAKPRNDTTAKADEKSGGSLWDQLDRAHKNKREQGTAVTKSEAVAKTLPEGWKQKIDGWWALYVKDDPAWPAARTEWLGMADPAPTILIENLLRAYVSGWESSQRFEFERAKKELLAIPDQSLPIVAIGLSRGSGDTVVRNISVELLAAAGSRSVPPIENAWQGATPKGRGELTRALRKLNDPSTVPLLARIATSREAFEPRIEALQGLGELKDPAGYQAVVTCLSDGDRSVRKFAAKSLGLYGRREAVPLLKTAEAQAQARGESDVAEECRSSIQMLGGGS
jgi:hypothetical protein